MAHHAEGRARRTGTSPSGFTSTTSCQTSTGISSIGTVFEAHAGIVEQEVEPPEFLGGAVEQPLHLFGPRNVTRHRDGRARRLPPRSGPRWQPLRDGSSVRPVNYGAPAVGNERRRDSTADPAACAGHDGVSGSTHARPLADLIKEIANGGRADKGGKVSTIKMGGHCGRPNEPSWEEKSRFDP